MGKMISLATPRGEVAAYLARPAGKCHGGVLVIHEVWGLVEHTKDVADRFAAAGYATLAPDLLSKDINVAAISGLQEDLFNPERRSAVQPELRKHTAPMQNKSFGEDTLIRLDSCFNYIYEDPETQQKVALTGFCFGGSYSFGLAVKEPRLLLALPFYGHADYDVTDLAMISCPVRAFYGENDQNLLEGLPELTQKMKKARVDFVAKVYPDAGHAFFNDTNRFAYNKAAAEDAWQLTLGYLKKYVG